MKPPYIPKKPWLLPLIILLMLAVGSVARCHRMKSRGDLRTEGR